MTLTGDSTHERTKTLQARLDLLRDRTRRLNEASLEINESLEFESVLRVVIDNARELTGASFGGIVVLDETANHRHFVTSGLTATQHHTVSETPGGPDFLDYVIGLSEPLRVRDLSAYFRSLGLPEFRHPLETNSYLAAPIRTSGEAVGGIFLSRGPPGPEFDDEDAATLAMFASQAALVITNARRYREEQRTRADLETLIDTSPVGVAVFDARTGLPVRLNREMRRIAAEVSKPDKPSMDLLERLTVRRADGRVTSLADEPLPPQMAVSETLRAEKIILSGPTGGSISVLANATPIRSRDDAVESLVVTVQDLAPLEELDRLRADLLGLVSAELRGPLVAVKGSAVTLLESLPTLDPAEITQLLQLVVTQADRMRDLIGELVDVSRIETGTLPVAIEPTEVDRLVDDAAQTLMNATSYKQVIVDIAAGLPLVTADRRRIVYVIDTLVSIASRLSKGPEPLQLTAALRDDHLELSVIDPSGGPTNESLARLFDRIAQGTRTAPASSLDSPTPGFGTELGLAVCKGIVEAHGGRLRAETDRDGAKTRYAFTLPQAKPTAHTTAPRHGKAPMAKRTAHIAVIEDDPPTLRYIHNTLTEAGHRVTVATDIDRALAAAALDPFDVLLASLETTRRDGIELAAALRPRFDGAVIVLAEYGHHEAITQAVNTGAADYIVKPFSPTELVTRVTAVLQQPGKTLPNHQDDQFAVGELTVDYHARTVTVAGNPVPLSRTEFQLMSELAQHAGHVLTHQELLYRVWHSTSPRDPAILRSAIKRLRRKLGDSATKPGYIVTARRVGYRLADPTQ